MGPQKWISLGASHQLNPALTKRYLCSLFNALKALCFFRFAQIHVCLSTLEKYLLFCDETTVYNLQRCPSNFTWHFQQCKHGCKHTNTEMHTLWKPVCVLSYAVDVTAHSANRKSSSYRRRNTAQAIRVNLVERGISLIACTAQTPHSLHSEFA